MSLSVVKNRMLELGFQGMLPALEGVLERLQKGELHVTEGIDLLLEHEWRFRQERATVAPISQLFAQRLLKFNVPFKGHRGWSTCR